MAEREITTRMRSRAFVISAALTLLIVLAGVMIGGIMQQRSADASANPEPAVVAVVGETPKALSGTRFEPRPAADEGQARAMVEAGEVAAAVVPEPGAAAVPAPLTVLALTEVPEGLEETLTYVPAVELLDGTPNGFNPFAYIIALGFGMVFYMTALTFGTTIAQSVVEEKQTRIVEILLATASARALMAGKVLGNSILALGSVVIILVLAAVGMLATGQDLLLGELGGSLIWFGVLFAFGFVLVATLYAAAASLVSRQEDVGSATSPVLMLVMAPFFLVIFFHDNERVLSILSYVPFSAPVGMPLRLVLDSARWWEPIVSLTLILLAIAVFVSLSARIYSNSILRTGARVRLADALKG
ncbi:ABC transporter permease [Brevibacterium album]|uniref:ABC transporter permease n=1 Tax=Brevibacterium album TaxID=417948 RepID=UPI001FE03F11|nr:ABC transporter permease [Brevibacterium album]